MALFDKFTDLEAYADESGTHDIKGLRPGAEVLAVVGFVARERALASNVAKVESPLAV